MNDLKPPRLAGDDRATIMALWQYQREPFVRKVDGLSDEDARRVLVPSGTSLLWLAQHLCMAEQLWVLQRFAGIDAAALDPRLVPGDSLGSAVAAYRATWRAVDDVVSASPLDAMCRNVEGPPTPLRWVIAHLLEETARHAGHADIIRELIDGRTGR